MSKVKDFFLKKDWNSIVSIYSTKDVCLSLNFSEAMHLVKHLFYDNIQDDEKQNYGLDLAFEIKDYFKNEWENDWKNDVFLGSLCLMLWRYDDQYICYKTAYDKLTNPPSELLLLLADCNNAPGIPPITDEESEFYLRQTLQKKITCEVALTMENFYKIKNDKLQKEYWNQIYQKLEKENIHADSLEPNVFKKNEKI
jgi:hypothetical protein